MYDQILMGIASGAAYALSGYKSKQFKLEDLDAIEFDFVKLFKSVLICGIVGALAAYFNKDFNLLITGIVGIGVTKAVSVLWNLGKVYLSKLKNKLFQE